MNTAVLLYDYSYNFILIMIRYLGIFLLTPVFSSRIVFKRLKIGLAFLLALITFPVLKETYFVVMPLEVIMIFLDTVRELAVGLIIGFVIYIVFAAIQLAGQLIDLRMGFRIANVMDPFSGESSPVIGQFQNIFAVLVFLAIDGHHTVIRNLYNSFSIIPPGGAGFPDKLWQYVINKSCDIFTTAFKVALPIIATIFIIDIILGFLVRSVPQMNIFIIGLPVKILIGFIILILTFHLMIYYYHDILNQVLKETMELIFLMAPD